MRHTRLLSTLAGLALLEGVLVAAPAEAVDTGTLSVVMLDEHGDPMPGQMQAYAADGGVVPAGSQGTHEWTVDVPAGEYGVLTISPWGGLLCAGLENECSILAVVGGAIEPDGSVVVTAGQTTEVVIKGKYPLSLHGPARVGRKLVVDWSPGMDNLLDYIGVIGGGGVYSPTYQWLRDGQPIPGATDATYRPLGRDAGRRLSMRVDYSDLMRQQFEMMTGAPVTPRTSNALEVTKVKTQSFATVVDPTISAGRQGRVRVEVTAPNQIVTGKVRVTVGRWSQTRSLRNGSARIVLPQLAPGRHAVRAAYLGTTVYAASKARPKTITVG